LVWKSLETHDRELANRNLKEEKERQGKIDADAAKVTLSNRASCLRKTKFGRQSPKNNDADAQKSEISTTIRNP
jgi:hypothetical protein